MTWMQGKDVTCLLASLLALTARTEGSLFNTWVACFDILSDGTGVAGHDLPACLTDPGRNSLFSVMMTMENRESMQILTFTRIRNFNLVKTRILFTSANTSEYIGVTTTTRFEKGGKMIVLSGNLVKGASDSVERVMQGRKVIQLITARDHKESGYIYHVYSMDRVSLSPGDREADEAVPDLDLIRNETSVIVSLDAQEVGSSVKQHRLFTAAPDLLFGPEAAATMSSNASCLSLIPDPRVADLGSTGPSLLPLFIVALIVFAALLLLSCCLTNRYVSQESMIIIHD